MKNNWIWVNVQYAFVEEDGVTYAYCIYFDVTAIKENEIRAQEMYESVRNELENISEDSLVSLRLNLTKNVVEDVHGQGLYDIDVCGMTISENFRKRVEIFPFERDKKKFNRNFNRRKLLAAYDGGITHLSDIFFCHLQNGEKSFVEYNVTLSRNPATGDIMAFTTERECNDDMVTDAILNKALVEQYDMIT